MSPRVYTRKFDYEEARARYAAGESIRDLAQEYGVSTSRVQQVVIPEMGRRAAERSAAFRWKCPECGAPTRGKGVRCKPCSVKLRATSVREDELYCFQCQQWKPDDDFPHSAHVGNRIRRGRHSQCRACNTIARREYRHRHREEQTAYDREYKRRRRQENKEYGR